MNTKRLSLIAIAAAFAVSSSAAMLQSARPALADADDHHPRQHQRADRDDRHNVRQDRDDRNYRRTTNTNGYWSNGQWHANNQNRNWNTNQNRTWNNNNQNRNWSYNRNPNGTWNNGNHYGQKKHRDRDHDHDRR
jgi:hypothetical protein